MSQNTKSPAEHKAKQRETKSLLINLFVATMIVILAVASTFFEFESSNSKIIMSTAIIISTVVGVFLLTRWIKSLDEYEAGINARASMIALYSSLLYLPFQYLSEINVIPEINIAFLFMFIWLVYMFAMFFIVCKKTNN